MSIAIVTQPEKNKYGRIRFLVVVKNNLTGKVITKIPCETYSEALDLIPLEYWNDPEERDKEEIIAKATLDNHEYVVLEWDR